MDYPRSVPGLGLVSGKFVDEDPTAGTPGSLIPAVWGNSVTQELLAVIKGAGIVADEADNEQLFKSINTLINGAKVSPVLSGDPRAPTPAQFDNGNSLATTAFAKRMGVEWSNFNAVNSNLALTNASVGGIVNAASATPINLIMPLTTGVPQAGVILINNASAGVATILAQSGDALTNQYGSMIPMNIGMGDSALLCRVNREWRLIGGTLTLKYSSLFAGLNGNPGYQKYPSGNIDQWGYGTTDANGEVYVTFPISFPTAFVSVVATHAGGDGAMVIMVSGSATKQGCRLKVRNFSGQVAAGWGVTYFAKGY